MRRWSAISANAGRRGSGEQQGSRTRRVALPAEVQDTAWRLSSTHCPPLSELAELLLSDPQAGLVEALRTGEDDKPGVRPL